MDRVDLSAIDANPYMSGDQAFLASDLTYVPGSGILSADVEGGFNYEFQIELGAAIHPATVLVTDLIL